MAKKRKRGRPASTEPTTSVGFRATDALVAALDVLAARNRRSRATEVLVAVEEYLAKHSLWPADGEKTPPVLRR